MEHSARFVIHSLSELQAYWGAGVSEAEHWSDAGNHFRNYLRSSSSTSLLVEQGLADTAAHCTYGEHHGKGEVDAALGHCSEWRDEASKLGPIFCAQEYVNALQRGATKRMDEWPMLSGVFKVFICFLTLFIAFCLLVDVGA